MPLLAGDKVESYELLRKCGRGAYGEVWLASDPLKRQVALKIIDKFSRAKDELKGLMTYFEMPPNPHLISIYHIGETEEFYYYTMELADNASDAPDKYIPMTLETVLEKNGPFSADSTYEFGKKMLEGLSALHKSGLVHRDLKPSNIIYINGEPKISDVGLIIKANVPATLIGSIGFITPERIASTSKKIYTAGDDLYALGKILYCYWTGNLPEEYPALPAKCFASPLDASLNDVIKRSCSNNPEKRFQNDQDFAEILKNSIVNIGTASQCKEDNVPGSSSQIPECVALGKSINHPLLSAIIFLALAMLVQAGFLLYRWSHISNLMDYYEHKHDYLVIDLSVGAYGREFPVRWSAKPPDLSSKVCRTSELWLKRIPAGSFMMGSPESEQYRQGNEALHKVDIQHDFYMGIFEVTQMQYFNVRFNNNSRAKGDTRPVEWLSYNDIRHSPKGWPKDGHKVVAESFVSNLQCKTGLCFDLPTEAEWEYACRSGSTGPFYIAESDDPLFTGIDPLSRIARFSKSIRSKKREEETLPEHTIVGYNMPNAWGLYDMLGNVWEYCLDWYEDNPSAQPGLTPKGPAKSTFGEHVIRGGDWMSTESDCRAARRCSADPSQPHKSVGFRIAYPSDMPDIILPRSEPFK